jgi:hypothetical protein
MSPPDEYDPNPTPESEPDPVPEFADPPPEVPDVVPELPGPVPEVPAAVPEFDPPAPAPDVHPEEPEPAPIPEPAPVPEVPEPAPLPEPAPVPAPPEPDPDDTPTTATLRLAARAYARHALPFTLLSALTLLPLAAVSYLRSAGPIDTSRANGVAVTAWIVAGVAWVGQLILVGAIAPAVRATAAAAPLSTFGALRHGLTGLRRAVIPGLAAAACVALGGLALAVPALLVLPLVALTGASPRLDQPLPAPLLDSAAIARGRMLLVGGTLVAMIALDLAATLGAQLTLIPRLPKAPSMDLLAHYRVFARVAIGAIIVLAPLPTTMLAAISARAR